MHMRQYHRNIGSTSKKDGIVVKLCSKNISQEAANGYYREMVVLEV